MLLCLGRAGIRIYEECYVGRRELSHLYTKITENSATIILQTDKTYSTVVSLMIYGVAQYHPFLV